MNSKIIGIDFTYIQEDKVSGIRKLGEEILEGLINLNEEGYQYLIFIDENMKNYYEKLFPTCRKVIIKKPFNNIKYIRGLYNKFCIPILKRFIISREKYDILIHPYTDFSTYLTGKENEISAILDVIPLDRIPKEDNYQYEKMKKKYKKLISKCKNIVTLSEYSKQRLIEINKEYEREIMVIPSPVKKLDIKSEFIPDIIKENKKYILTINSFLKSKNQITLVKAFNIIKDKVEDDLVMVGRPELESKYSGYNEVKSYIKEFNLEDRVKILSFISDDERNSLLYNADIFVSTSTQEGFGRTPVEAAMCGIPVISSTDTSLKEATLSLVNYYENATDENELADVILDVKNNRPSEEALKQIAQKIENEYNEKNIANKYLKVIDMILKEKVNE